MLNKKYSDACYKIIDWAKNTIQKETKDSILNFEYETFNNLEIYPLEHQLNLINNKIIKFGNILNSGHPFIAYNFANGIFDEDNYFELETIDIITSLCDDLDVELIDLEENVYSHLLKANELIKDNNSKLSKTISSISIEYSRAKYLEALILKRNELTGSNELHVDKNPHPRIFKSELGFRIFERLQGTVEQRYNLAGYSFIYRRMYKDNYINDYVGDSEFRDWLSDNYEIVIDKTKQLHNCTSKLKEQTYTTIIELIKQEF